MYTVTFALNTAFFKTKLLFFISGLVGSMAAAKVPDFSYSCEICGLEGLNDEQLRSHMLLQHLEGAVSCPFCDLGDISADELLVHVNSAHLEYLTPEHELLAFIDDDDEDHLPPPRYGIATAASPDVDLDDAASPAEPYYNTLQRFLRGAHSSQPEPQPVAQHNHVADRYRCLEPAGKPWDHSWNHNNNLNNNNEVVEEEPAPAVHQQPPAGGSVAPQGSPLRSQLALNLKQRSSPAKQDIEQQCPLCPFRHASPLLLEEHINRQHFDLTSPSFPPPSPASSLGAVGGATTTFGGSARRRGDVNYNCPFCARIFHDSPDLELHVNIEHKDILSPSKVFKEIWQKFSWLIVS